MAHSWKWTSQFHDCPTLMVPATIAPMTNTDAKQRHITPTLTLDQCWVRDQGAFHQAFCQWFSLTNFISYWNPCIWLAESKFVSEKHWQNAWWNAPQRCRDQDQAQQWKSHLDFVHSARPRSRPRQGKVEINTGFKPNTVLNLALPITLTLLPRTKSQIITQ